jgi:hypothetical protein
MQKTNYLLVFLHHVVFGTFSARFAIVKTLLRTLQLVISLFWFTTGHWCIKEDS